MNKDNKNIENRIKNDAVGFTPDIWEEVEKEIKNGKGEVVALPREKRKGRIKSIISTIAAALVLISITTYAIINHDRIDKKIATTVYMEVNPQIELSLNAYNKVLKVTPHNKDGEKVLGEMKLTDCSLDVALNSIIGSMYQKGYLNDHSNSVLLSVKNDKSKDARQVCYSVLKTFEDLKKHSELGKDFPSAAVVHVLDDEEEAKKLAEENKISVAKADFIMAIRDRGIKRSFEELAKLSVNDLNLIFEGLDDHDMHEYRKDEYYGPIGYYGKASESDYIGTEKAKEIALKDAGLKEADLTDLDVDLDYEMGDMVYDVEFEIDEIEYYYIIDALSGSIFSSNKVTPNFKLPTQSTTPDLTPSSKPSTSFEAEVSSKPQTSSKENSSSKANAPSNKIDAVISPQRAIEYAIIHAGVDKDEVRGAEAEIDMELHEKYHYDVEFSAKGYDYEYEIDAISGAVLKSEKEFDD